jgi:hypothetical protein
MNGFARRELGPTRAYVRGEHFLAVSSHLSWEELPWIYRTSTTASS